VELYLLSSDTPSWRGAQLRHRDNFTFTFIHSIIIIITTTTTTTIIIIIIIIIIIFSNRIDLTFSVTH
jgi:hypothetical protein